MVWEGGERKLTPYPIMAGVTTPPVLDGWNVRADTNITESVIVVLSGNVDTCSLSERNSPQTGREISRSHYARPSASQNSVTAVTASALA